MAENGKPSPATTDLSPAPDDLGASGRLRLFLFVQVLFLLVTPLTGGFHFRLWSMLDTSLLLASIGITALVPVMESAAQRRAVLWIGIVLYLLGILDMSINVLVSGVVGWD